MMKLFEPIFHPSSLSLRAFVVILSLLVFCAPAHAQLSRLDKGTLIEGLRDEGLRDLLKHFAATELGGDPVLQSQVIMSQHLLDYEDELAVGNTEGAAAAFGKAVQVSRDMIETHADHEQRPIWQTQLAEQILFESLGTLGRNADRFYEFGVPSKDQRAIFQDVVPTALDEMEDADVRFFKLQSDLPKQEDHTEKRIDTGLWDRMMNQYYNVRTQYMLSIALYYTWLLPDDHPYYQNLGNNPKIIRQKKDIASERARLLSLAAERLEQLLVGGKAQEWGIARGVESMLGRVQSAQGKAGDAETHLQKVIDTEGKDLQDLWAQLGLGLAQTRAKQFRPAQTLLEALRGHPILRESMLLRLLVVDAMHRSKLAEAETKTGKERDAGIAQAYQPYMDLLADASLAEAREGIRDYVYKRWTDNVSPGDDLSKRPAVVVGAVGRMMRIDGQNGALGGDPDADQTLNLAYKINSDLLKRDNLLPDIAAGAMYNKAVALYFLNQNNVEKILEAATIMIDLADQYPSAPIAPEAITSAVAGVLHTLHDKPTPTSNVDALYRRAVEVLLGKLGGIEAAHNERLYYAVRVLMPDGRNAEAVKVLSALPKDHTTYLEAQREMLYAQLAILAGSPDDASLKQQIAQESQRVYTDAMQQSSGPSDAAIIALNVAGHARLVQGELAARQNDYEKAVGMLADFEENFAADPELVREALARRITWLAQLERYDDASAAAERMMAAYADDAAPVIDQVLTDLDTAIDALRQAAGKEIVDRKREAMQARATGMAKAARKLAELLRNWAKAQGFGPDDMVGFDLLLAKSLRTAGEPAEAMKILAPVAEKYPDDIDVIIESAETFYAMGDPANLRKASPLYTALLSGLPPDDEGNYPREYWQSWMRYLQIADKLNENTGEIGLLVQQLQMSSPNLGGEPYKSELQRLANKYGR